MGVPHACLCHVVEQQQTCCGLGLGQQQYLTAYDSVTCPAWRLLLRWELVKVRYRNWFCPHPLSRPVLHMLCCCLQTLRLRPPWAPSSGMNGLMAPGQSCFPIPPISPRSAPQASTANSSGHPYNTVWLTGPAAASWLHSSCVMRAGHTIVGHQPREGLELHHQVAPIMAAHGCRSMQHDVARPAGASLLALQIVASEAIDA